MKSIILAVQSLGSRWPCIDPFLFCAYHLDHYPAGTPEMSAAVDLKGRDLGQDFGGKDGFSMYHGLSVPGFPQHPHRGFETVTIASRGIVDHADSLGAAARFGMGDAQWITSGKGISHSEMFPLLNRHERNPLELFQIWLNLPKNKKLVDPYFSIFWDEQIPKVSLMQGEKLAGRLTLIAGSFAGQTALPPPPDSWAAEDKNQLAIWLLEISPSGEITLPAAQGECHRVLYFYEGESLEVADKEVLAKSAIQVEAATALKLRANHGPAKILVLQGRPIGEPVAQHGPFVMNTQTELQQAFQEYQRTEFGGWPWPSEAPVHAREESRFARYPDGRIERPSSK